MLIPGDRVIFIREGLHEWDWSAISPPLMNSLGNWIFLKEGEHIGKLGSAEFGEL